MSFRFKLLILVPAVAVLPILFSAFIFYLRGVNTRASGHPPANRFLVMMRWIDEQLPEAWRAGDPRAALKELPEGEELIVVDNDGRIVLSTVPGFDVGEQPGAERIYESIMAENRFRGMITPVVIDNRTVGAVIQREPRFPDSAAKLALHLEGPLVYLSALVVVATILILIVTRSLRRGIGNLDKATARVADGDLDFELEPKGKDELADLTRSFESMRRALKEEYARRSRFLMAVSHDLKTPLTSIKGYLEAVQDGMAEDPSVLKAYVKIISDKSGVLEARINELIDYVKMSTGQWQFKHNPINLHRFLSGLARAFAADAPVFRRRFESRIELPEEMELPGDEGLLARALDNLFHNALRYTREGDSIRLIAREKNGEALIIFADSGFGVTEEELERIFEPFYRGTNSRRESGSGLGLSTVRSILDAHGWNIEATSPPGSGLTFVIRTSTARSG